MLNPFKKTQYIEVPVEHKMEKLFEKCPVCKEILIKKELNKNYKVCPKCQHHFRLGARERIEQVIDEGTFVEINEHMVSTNILDFPAYEDKIKEAMTKSGNLEAIVTGIGQIESHPVMFCAMDSLFMMGSMGVVVGEKICLAIEEAITKRLPLVIVTASGGARMQEGIYSLMQMAKTAAMLKIFEKEKLLYVAVLTDPTTGGVTASFASLGDILIGEPGALIGFTGPRVIEQTIKEKLPEGFQKAEFLLEKGLIDLIVPRNKLKSTLGNIIQLHTEGREI
jgi:acetyl-CoA carboxylase carboxyl transferase subunit beta